MGRAIDMENDISKLKQEVSELKKVLQEILNEVKKDEKKKTNVKGSTNSNRKVNTGTVKSKPDDNGSD
jgi:sugar-specific transcriptional regulator TrmB|tara:strand:+ start:276 stop:479 length:204 start_codon:yes stop_codon:yes gene_type:complete